MNNRFLILLVSLLANAALGFFLVRQVPAVASSDSAVKSTEHRESVISSPVSAELISAIRLNQENWTHLNVTDDVAFVARLRAAGFPSDMILTLVNSRLRLRYADLFKRLQPAANHPYWQRSYDQSSASPDERAARRALERELADERKKILGADFDQATLAARRQRERLYGNIPAGKADQLQTIVRDYGDLVSSVREQSKGIILPEDRAQLALLEREKRADLAALLTPAELAEYDLRSSPSASVVRNRLRNFDTTEDEYRRLVSLQLEFDQQYGPLNLLTASQRQDRTEALKGLDDRIKATFSPERLVDYEIKTDPAYSRISSLLTQFKVSGTTPDTLVAMQQDLTQRANAIRQDRTLDTSSRDAQLKVLSGEATTRLKTALGGDAFKEYKSNGGPLNSLLNRAR